MIMSAETHPKKRRRVSACVGCGSAIQDQFILRVAPDLEWHAACLKCADCNQFLDETCTCFVRDGKTYCKRDYVRLFGTKCGKCNQGFNKNEFVMRVKAGVFHIECFRCVACSRQLIPGDEFALREDGLFCKADHEVVERAQQNGETIPPHNNNNDPRLSAGIQLSTAGHVEQLHQSPNSNTHHRSGERIRSHVHKSDTKTTRVRTVLNEKQLHTLRTCYNANPRPDALMKEQLTEMTSLSPRVIRVWFQNKRCKDKKRSILMKQMQDQQQKNGNRLQGPLTGVPMVASSPVRHESPMQVHPVEVQGYTQATPWKELNYGMDVDSGHFQSLMVDSFDDGDGLSGGQYLSGDDSNMRAPSSMSSDEIIEHIHSEMSSPNSS